MSGDDAGLIEAIDMAMEAEWKAREFYSDAQGKVASARGKDLLGQLAAFEKGHYDRLSELKDSLSGDKGFIQYPGTEFTTCSAACESEVQGEVKEDKDVLVGILNLAIEAETKARDKYLTMVNMTEDPRGKDMFRKLADEELLHRRILSDEFYHVTNRGEWVWAE